jgi:hypothetical protein
VKCLYCIENKDWFIVLLDKKAKSISKLLLFNQATDGHPVKTESSS